MNAVDLLLVITCFSMFNPPTWHKMRLGEFQSSLPILRPFWNQFFDISQSRVHGAETPTKNNNCWLQLWWAKGSNQRYLGKGNNIFAGFQKNTASIPSLISPGHPPGEAADDPKENNDKEDNDATAELVRGTSEERKETVQQEQERWHHPPGLIYHTALLIIQPLP